MTLVRAGVDTAADESIDALLSIKTQGIAVCIPARNEADTITAVVDCAARLHRAGVVDEIVVVDDHSSDDTAERAAAAGATVVAGRGSHGKGQALRRALAATSSELVVFLDADVTNIHDRFITALVMPLLEYPAVELVKPTYRRPFNGRSDEGGRVTELLARPLLRRFFYNRGGPTAIVEAELGERVHRNRPLAELRHCADDVLAAVIARLASVPLHAAR